MRFTWVAYDEGNCEIEGCQFESIEANSIGHALQKIVGRLPDEEPHEVQVWHAREQK